MPGTADGNRTGKQPHRNLECCRAWAVQFAGNGDEQCQAVASLEKGTHDIPLLVAGVARLIDAHSREKGKAPPTDTGGLSIYQEW